MIFKYTMSFFFQLNHLKGIRKLPLHPKGDQTAFSNPKVRRPQFLYEISPWGVNHSTVTRGAVINMKHGSAMHGLKKIGIKLDVVDSFDTLQQTTFYIPQIEMTKEQECFSESI